MTRFARAQGSKASNVREPEEATPWNVLKGNLAKRKMANPEDEDEQDFVENEEDEQITEEVKDEGREEVQKDDEDEERKKEQVGKQVEEKVKEEKTDKCNPETEEQSKKKKKNKSLSQRDKCLNCKEKGHLKMDCPQLPEERREELRRLRKMKEQNKGNPTGRIKNKNKQGRDQEQRSTGKGLQQNRKWQNGNDNGMQKKKQLLDRSNQPVQDGEGLFHGFRVKKEDVKRLKKLQKTLNKKKLSKKEIEETMKMERRRAEKELARSKKMVCYNCRQPGHLLSECTVEVNTKGKNLKAGGLCFKCGSAEHTSKECKSKRKHEEAFAFAVCFICNETGHLAKACPDNPRGIYPKGGGCRFCGSVEHLKNECPRKIEKDSRNEVRAQRLDEGDLEGEHDQAPVKKKVKVEAKKVVLF